MRRCIYLLAVLLLAAPVDARAQEGGLVLGEDLPHAHNDRPITLGGARPSPSHSILAETAGGVTNLSAVIPADSCALLSSDNNVDRSTLTCTDTRLCVCSDDAADPDGCICVYNDEAASYVASSGGRLKLSTGATGIVDILDPSGNVGWSYQNTASKAEFWSQANNQVGFVAATHQNFQQVTFAVRGGVGTAGGRQLILTDYDNRNADHSITTQDDPALYLFAALDPSGPDTIPGNADDPKDWLRAGHNRTDGVLSTGSGALQLNPASLKADFFVGNAATWHFEGSTTNRPRMSVFADSTEAFSLTVQSTFDQVTLDLGASGVSGNQLILTTMPYRGSDHGYDADADPAAYFQSGADPSSGQLGEDEAVKIQYVAADDAGYVGTMKGPLRLNPAAAAVRLPRILADVPVEPHACAADADIGGATVVSDTNDGVADVVCVCLASGDAGGANNAWDWRRMDDNAVACPAF